MIMLRAACLAFFLVAQPLVAQPVDSAKASERGDNAALKYWQAFATMPKLTQAEQNQLADYAEYPVNPQDAHVREIVSQAEYALQMMYRGAAMRHCDWGISYEDGVLLLLPQGSAARALTSLGRLRGRMRLEAGQTKEGIDDFVAAMTLSRHVSQGGGFIMILVGYALEARLSEWLAVYLPKFDAKTMKDLQARLQALPPFGSQVTSLMTCERETMDWFVRKVKETKDKESLLALLSFINVSEGKPGPGDKARAFLEECGGTAEGIIKYAVKARPSYERIAQKLDLPVDEFEKEFERESAKQASNPVYKVFFPALAKVRQARARADVRRALFSAALDVQLNGKDALKDHADPVAGGPFDYVAFAGGFELRSRYKGPDDKPLTLIVGRRGN
jgi:hypothetical protein